MIIECVPNFSEGRDANVISALTEAARPVLLNATSDPDHNRTVLTLAGSPHDVTEAAFRTVRTASKMIDLTKHTGVHPRLGAADIVPLVPVSSGITLEDCAKLAYTLGKRIWEELHIPVCFYEAAALRPECVRLPDIRRNNPAPDLGPAPHPTAGICVVGARNFLIAWNINLRSTDLTVAKAIAKAIRALPGVRSVGLPLSSRHQVQVSINLTDFEKTPLHVIFEAVARHCVEMAGVEIAGSELIGMIPAAALASSAGHDLHWENFKPELVLENRLCTLN